MPDGERSTGRRALLGALATGVGAGALAAGARRRTASDARLVVPHEDQLIDEPPTIRIEGLAPGDGATLFATFGDAEQWVSFARFEADADGTVDVAEHAPIEGTYSGVDPTGLLWSRRPVDSDEPGQAAWIGGDGRRTRIVARHEGRRIDEVEVTRWVWRPSGDTVDWPDRPGQLVLPHGDGPHPGAILLHGSFGNVQWFPARYLAGKGVATYAMRYLGGEGQPDVADEVPVEVVVQAARRLREHPAVNDGPIALLGTSQGGELAMLASRLIEDVAGVVSFVGSSVVLQGHPHAAGSPWSVGGEPVPYLPVYPSLSAAGRYAVHAAAGRPGRHDEIVDDALDAAAPEDVAAATVPVEEIDAPLLLFSATDDASWPSARLGRVAERRREAHDLPVEHRVYDGAGHRLVVPYLPTTRSTRTAAKVGPPGRTWGGGGTPARNAAAGADAWKRTVAFLQEVLP